jgi:Spy/CpxP family protein refolding chaperone
MTQTQREALLDLLHIAMFTDSHVSLKEEAELHRAIEAIGWDSSRPREIHLLNSMANARRAADSAETSAAYIAERAAEFGTTEEQQQALTLLQSLISSDGDGAEEIAFLAQVRSAFP